MDPPRLTWRSDLLAGALVYILSTIPVVFGVTIANASDAIESRLTPPEPGVLGTCCHYDGGHYLHIVIHGYWYERDRPSGVAFFPALPLGAWAIHTATGCSPRLALLLIANGAFLVALVAISAYLRTGTPRTRWTTLALVGLCPVGFCFRMAYSESLLLAGLALVMLGLARRWPVRVIAIIAGAATGIRPVGLAATAALFVHIFNDRDRGSMCNRIGTCAAILPLACWGLLAYMGYLLDRFDNPLAFVHAQQQWSNYAPRHPEPFDKAARLAIAEPIWGCYLPGSSRHWTRFDDHENPLLGTAFWNPILFVLAGVLVAIGWVRGWLTHPEVVLGFCLLVMPYITRSDEQSMISHARFAAVVLPAYIVLGRYASRLPPAIVGIALAGMAVLLTVWSALFAAGWPLL